MRSKSRIQSGIVTLSSLLYLFPVYKYYAIQELLWNYIGAHLFILITLFSVISDGSLLEFMYQEKVNQYLLNKLILLDKLFACTGFFYTLFPLLLINKNLPILLLNILCVLFPLYIARSNIGNDTNNWVLFQTVWHINSSVFVGMFGPLKAPIHLGFIELY
jgi:hypothetical protein